MRCCGIHGLPANVANWLPVLMLALQHSQVIGYRALLMYPSVAPGHVSA